MVVIDNRHSPQIFQNHGFTVIIDNEFAPSVIVGAVDIAEPPAAVALSSQDVQSFSIVHDNGPLFDYQPGHRHSELFARYIRLRLLHPIPFGHPAPPDADDGHSHL